MDRELEIDGKLITDDGDCYIVAEIGHNHQGNLQTALELVKAAKDCGADAVKFQKRDNQNLYTKELYDLPYDHENSFGKTYGEHREALEFGMEEYRDIMGYAQELGITMFATAFDVKSADFLQELGVPAFKVASGDLFNHPLMEYIAQFQKPMLVSTGGGNMVNVKQVYETVMPINHRLCIMQTTASYPCAFNELNLCVIQRYREVFDDIIIGLSSHDNGIAMALAGYVMGARIIEKHFTLNRAMKGTDHAYSLEPQGLRKLVRDLKRARVAKGDGEKRFLESEKKGIYKMGKKMVATRDLEVSHEIEYSDIAIKSPNDGLPPSLMFKVEGGTVIEPIKKDEAFTFKNVSPTLKLIK